MPTYSYSIKKKQFRSINSTNGFGINGCLCAHMLRPIPRLTFTCSQRQQNFRSGAPLLDWENILLKNTHSAAVILGLCFPPTSKVCPHPNCVWHLKAASDSDRRLAAINKKLFIKAIINYPKISSPPLFPQQQALLCIPGPAYYSQKPNFLYQISPPRKRSIQYFA